MSLWRLLCFSLMFAVPFSACPAGPALGADRTHAVLLNDSEGKPHAFAAGRAPDAAHPQGTLLIAYSSRDKAFVAEVDLATLVTFAKTQVAAEEAWVSFAQEGSHTYALIETAKEHRFVEVRDGPSVTPLARLKGSFERALAFTVVGARPIVLIDLSPATVLAFNSDGRIAAKRRCKGGLEEMNMHDLHVRDGRVFVLHMLMDDDITEGVCAFDANGKGPVDVLRVTMSQSFRLEKMELAGEDDAGNDWVAPVDRRLKVGRKHKVSAEPAASESRSCKGVSGTAIKKTASVHGVRIVHTYSCCGDRGPSGIWVCPK